MRRDRLHFGDTSDAPGDHLPLSGGEPDGILAVQHGSIRVVPRTLREPVVGEVPYSALAEDETNAAASMMMANLFIAYLLKTFRRHTER